LYYRDVSICEQGLLFEVTPLFAIDKTLYTTFYISALEILLLTYLLVNKCIARDDDDTAAVYVQLYSLWGLRNEVDAYPGRSK